MDAAIVEREKDLLPFGWGRFGKSLEKLPELLGPEEELLAACVGLNPTFEHRSITLAGGLRELTKSTNVVLAATDRRLLLIATGAGGAPREHSELAYEGMKVEKAGKRELKLTWPEGSMLIKGMAKPMLPSFEGALQGRLAG
ncbi:MAG: hypothetical protein JST08_03015 [Actinobacteria bacterium]|nr:hypothetical protein [Actinomycetota bacterium]